MSDSPRESGHPWTSKLHEITPGRRTLSWLLGKSPYHWVDRRMAGTLVQRLARTSSPKTLAAWPGPVASCRHWGIPLSWFAVPLTTHDAMRSLTDSMNNMLLTAQSGCQTPDILSLMQRVLETDALHPANRLTIPQRIFESHSPRSRIVLVDERSHSATNPGSPERARRRAFRAMLQNARSAHPDAEFWLARSSDPGSGASCRPIRHCPATFAGFTNRIHSEKCSVQPIICTSLVRRKGSAGYWPMSLRMCSASRTTQDGASRTTRSNFRNERLARHFLHF